MNKLPGIITRIQQSGAILLIDLEVDGQRFSALLIEAATSQHWLCEGNAIDLVFKETEVSLAKGLAGKISTRNRMMCSVIGLERGGLLSRVNLRFLNYTIVSAITTRALDSLQIKIGEEIEALVKSNEIALMQKSV